MNEFKRISTAERRGNRERYFKEQDYTTEKYVVPYIEQYKKLNANARILEIGCGEGGNLKYFVSKKYDVTGIDLNQTQIERSQVYLDKFCDNPSNLKLINQNIYDASPEDLGQFDLIMMRDVIEHIPNQEKFISFLHKFIKPDGVIFFGFPPWYMPFGGHQQGCKSFLKKVPFFHILPMFMYLGILKIFNEKESFINNLKGIKETGITIDRFKRIIKQNDWVTLNETLYFINPNYDVKFKLKPRKQLSLLGIIPFFRNFYTTCAYYIITPKK